MKTRLGSITINDSHCHFFTHSVFKMIGSQKFKAGDPVKSAADFLGWDAPPHSPIDLARRWADELDHHGVQRVSLIASVPKDEDSVAEAVKHFPDRFVGFFMLDPTQPDAVERAQRALGELKLRVVCFYPAMHHYSLRDDRVKAVLDVVAEAPGRGVFVHCGVLTVGIRKKLDLPSPFDLKLGNPLDLATIAPAYPKTNFILPHLGAGMLREALMLAEVCSNVHLDTSSSNSWVRYLGIPLREALNRALSVVGPERLLFGTDSSFFPRGWNKKVFDEQLAIFERLKVKRADVKAILGGNFERLFPA
ncbi:MAG TPA: amidohydrolase family protein [Acidobacteriota bacterium]|jgi:hypothetical protein|nr:amidohydrolase family protein [Acidobacteriota bacterium]